MRKTIIAFAAVAVLMLAACGDASTDSPPADDDNGTTVTTAPPITTTTVQDATTTTTSPPVTTTTTSPPVTTTTLPPSPDADGDWYDLWVGQPGEGLVVGVVGVAFDDTLNVRSGPGIAFDVVAELGPTQSGIVGTGHGWQLPSGEVWWRIEVDGVIGWANQRYLSRLGPVDDSTSAVVALLGEIPTAETMLELGRIVADALAEGPGFDVTLVEAPTVGDLGEVTFDLTGSGDDSIAGYRLHVFGQPSDSGEGFFLGAVEATSFCQRGIHDGRCA